MAKVGRGVQLGLSWVKTKRGDLPDGAIQTQPGVYVCRAWHEGEQIPGKYVPRYALAYVSYGGKEHQETECEVLCDTSCPGKSCCYEWVSASGGEVPKKAIVAGIASDGQPLYIAKALVGDEVCGGKVHNGHSCAYMPYADDEHAVDKYEVLVWKKE
uniref:Natterin-4 n=1 Tax=Schistocephalus solidus TaxID=70667 RepID=A0A0X3NQ94_SCHSO